MKIAFPKCDLSVYFKENEVIVFNLENQIIFGEIVSDIFHQSNGEPGDAILSEGEKVLSFDKVAEVIVNPIALDLNRRKVHANLYKELVDISNEVFFEETGNINSYIVNYLDDLIKELPYNIEIDADLDVKDLLKSFNVRIGTDGNTIAENIIDYMKVMHQICNLQLFVFVNIKSYLRREEIEQVYEAAFLEKVNLLLIEAKYGESLRYEKNVIIDSDMCRIDV